MIHFDFDVAPEEDLNLPSGRVAVVRTILKAATRHGCAFRRVRWEGPAGGNPQVFVDAPTREAGRAFVAEMYGFDLADEVNVETCVDPCLEGAEDGPWPESELPGEFDRYERRRS